MEPTHLIVEQLKKIREAIDGNRGELVALRGDVQRNTAAISGLANRTFALEEAVVANTAQVTMLARSVTVTMESRARLEDRVDAIEARVDTLERER